MLGIEILNKIYVNKELKPGTKIGYGSRVFAIEKVNSGFALRECVTAPKNGKMVHNFSFSELLEFMNSECCILPQFTFGEAARRNQKMKPCIIDNIGYMSLKEALLYLSSVSDASLLKTLLEDKVWCT